jgi:hypothetical protein
MLAISQKTGKQDLALERYASESSNSLTGFPEKFACSFHPLCLHSIPSVTPPFLLLTLQLLHICDLET